MRHAVLGLALLLSACAPRAADPPAPTGFLGDYARLAPGARGELRWVDRGADLAGYAAIWIESVALWGAELAAVPAPPRQELTDRLYRALHDELIKDWILVDKPGPQVLRLRAALSAPRATDFALDTTTRTLPGLRRLAPLGHLTPELALLLSEAAAEVELADSLSGGTLVALLDEPLARHGPGRAVGRWGEVQAAFDLWAEALRFDLQDLRTGRRL